MSRQLTAAVVLASAGRPDLLADALRTVADQEDVEFTTVVSVPDEASLPADRKLLTDVVVVTGTRGLAAQRNAGIAALDPATQVVAFFDDDTVLRKDWMAVALAFLAQHPDIVGLTGRPLLDGAVSGEISVDRTRAAIAASARRVASGAWEQHEELYGCNFAIRLDLIGDERFDERLPLYSWLEDHDMARRLLRCGRLAKVDDCVMVHRAAASGGRQNHLRLGYSQVMNPVYLWRKGSFSLVRAIDHLGRRVLKNLALSLLGPDRELRRKRLRGNAVAVGDIARRRITPERIVDLTDGGGR